MILNSFAGITLPEGQEGFECNFGSLRQTILPLAASQGGFDTFGTGRGYSDVGLVGKTFLVYADTPTAYQTALDTFRAISYAGAGSLVGSWDDGTTTRYCTARVYTNDIVANGRLWSQHRVTWQVAYPRWLASTATTTNISASGATTDTTITNAGNAFSLPTITLSCGIGQTCEDATFRIMDGSTILDEFSYDGVINNASGSLVVNCLDKSITLNSVLLTLSDTTRDYPDIIRLRSGANTFRVVFANVGDAATVSVVHRGTWV